MPIADDMKNIAEGIEISYGERVAFLSDLSKDTHETLKAFHHHHQKMASDLWDSLSSDRTNREKDTVELMIQIREDISSMSREIKNELTSTTRERIEQVKKMLATFSAEHEVQSRQLRHQLSSFQKQLESTVKEMRAPVMRDLKEARQNWQNLARIMAARRAGKAVSVAQKIEGVPKEEVAEAVEAFTAGSLKEQILRMVSEAVSGISLSQMGRALRIPYVRLAKPVSELVREGEIKKEDSEYLKV